MIQLGVNIDHVASVRNARYRGSHVHDGEPDPVRAAHEAELGGADGITLHLREDRRHIQDRDLELLRKLARIKVNLEMAATEPMLQIAVRLCPHTAMLVPEGRDEVTTEGGLDVRAQLPRLKDITARLKSAGLIVSAFIDPDLKQVDACVAAGFDVCEIHTGPYAHAFSDSGGDFRRKTLAAELDKVRAAGEHIRASGLRFNAGHALNYHNVAPIAQLMGVSELHIGHAIVSRAIFTGLRTAVSDMKTIMLAAARRA